MDLFQQAAGVLIVLGALAAVLVIGKHRGLVMFGMPSRSAGRPRRMQVLERLPLTPQHSLHLVTVDGRTVLVGVSPGGCQLLEKDSPQGGQPS
ncbi:MAG TPA: flagellar biosynthetic protein FliO [Bryobacteraceae bacterium]|nr:flagellar biosynthetic protein FliO [Bryobacteraceae bacterium]